jgi:hypothetical protein
LIMFWKKFHDWKYFFFFLNTYGDFSNKFLFIFWYFYELLIWLFYQIDIKSNNLLSHENSILLLTK